MYHNFIKSSKRDFFGTRNPSMAPIKDPKETYNCIRNLLEEKLEKEHNQDQISQITVAEKKIDETNIITYFIALRPEYENFPTEDATEYLDYQIYIITELLECGCDINGKISDKLYSNFTAAMLYCMILPGNQKTDITIAMMKFLIENGAIIDNNTVKALALSIDQLMNDYRVPFIEFFFNHIKSIDLNKIDKNNRSNYTDIQDLQACNTYKEFLFQMIKLYCTLTYESPCSENGNCTYNGYYNDTLQVLFNKTPNIGMGNLIAQQREEAKNQNKRIPEHNLHEAREKYCQIIKLASAAVLVHTRQTHESNVV